MNRDLLLGDSLQTATPAVRELTVESFFAEEKARKRTF